MESSCVSQDLSKKQNILWGFWRDKSPFNKGTIYRSVGRVKSIKKGCWGTRPEKVKGGKDAFEVYLGGQSLWRGATLEKPQSWKDSNTTEWAKQGKTFPTTLSSHPSITYLCLLLVEPKCKPEGKGALVIKLESVCFLGKKSREKQRTNWGDQGILDTRED